MKKKLTYPLLAVVLVLWGLIFYRIFSGLSGSEPVDPVSKVAPPTEPQREKVEDDSLLLNYRDPFLGNMMEDAIDSADEELYADEYVEPEPYIDWSMVQYYGSVNNTKDGKTVALVSINGREYMLKPGETVDGYTLLSKTGNSIMVSHQGQVGTIAMQGQ
ncbi:hypothetical protein [Parapedobacter tibetensis]|uniref:hypothetical protein n=1 Tax=Parapedobacter tibetensis TaxID=2972951 RepID=UPI00214D27A1|nr:hypothetical protein [Parapedobacter tibetensis]